MVFECVCPKCDVTTTIEQSTLPKQVKCRRCGKVFSPNPETGDPPETTSTPAVEAPGIDLDFDLDPEPKRNTTNKSRSDDEDDVPEKRPFRKGGRDDDDYDDAPAKRKEKASKRSRIPLWIPLSGLGLVGVIVLIIVLASGGSKEKEERKDKDFAETKSPIAKESNRKKTPPKEPDVTPPEDAGQKVFNQGVKSTAFIIRPIDESTAAIGSGSLIDVRKKLVITNEHVVGDAKEVIVFFAMFDNSKPVNDKKQYLQSGGYRLTGHVLHTDSARDLAVIELETLNTSARPVKFAADSPPVGANVHSIGNPAASDALWVYTPGKVRSVYKKTWIAGKQRKEYSATIIEATSPTSPGDSGGPLFNDKGEQIGVTQGGIDDPRAQNFSYFIDVSEVKAFLKEHRITLSAPKP